MLSITLNGQLMLCMLSERLIQVPTLRILMVNTDGITYFVHKDHEPLAVQICKEWENLTGLVLEDAGYSRLFLRDVNSYVAESLDKTLKCKGAYWTPDPLNYHESLANAQPPAWHKDLSNLVIINAAVSAMVHNTVPDEFIKNCKNPYDFMCRIKVKKSDRLMHGGIEIQRTSRYYVSKTGNDLIKLAPPVGTPGMYKKSNNVSDADYERVMKETGGRWDERVCTKNKSVYENRETSIVAGYKTTICNNVEDFSFDNVNYDWYISEARKLVI